MCGIQVFTVAAGGLVQGLSTARSGADQVCKRRLVGAQVRRGSSSVTGWRARGGGEVSEDAER